jgi:hypothetical protein
MLRVVLHRLQIHDIHQVKIGSGAQQRGRLLHGEHDAASNGTAYAGR